MSYELTGAVTEVFPTKTVGSKGFQKREFRVREKSDSQYPNFVAFVLTKDKCNLADSLTEGTEITVHFNISGRIWDKGDGSETRCFVELQAWKIDIIKPANQVAADTAEPEGVEDIDVPF